jgi:MSHA biogenesis protein MshI
MEKQMGISLPWLKKSNTSVGRIGITMGPDGSRLAWVSGEGVVKFCLMNDDAGQTSALVKGLVKQNGWEGLPCSLVLHPLYYQLLLAETPAVEAGEMSSAVRWRIKDLLDYPVEDAAVAHFELPEDAYRGQKKMLYAAVLRKSILQELVESIEESGLVVDCIEVAELALNNVFSRVVEGEEGSAVIHLMENEGLINLVEDKQIYLCRRLDVGMASFAGGSDPAFLESLLLEVQRSLDFYESQLGKGIISKLYYSPGSTHTAVIGEYLSQQLGLEISPLKLDNFLAENVERDTAINCVAAIGAALGPVISGPVISSAKADNKQETAVATH